jgi:ABC-type glycerol-3-phosphate transport system substrate-binding protein
MKKNMVFCWLLVAMFYIALPGYSGGNSSGSRPGEKKTIRYMVWGSVEYESEYLKYFKEQFPEFAEKYNIEVFVGGGGDGALAEKIRLGLAANDSVTDISRLNYTQIAEFARAGVLASTEDVIAPVRNDMLTGFRMLSEYNGRAVTVPDSIKTRIWYYRKDIFDKAGVDISTIKTVDDFIVAGKKVQQIDPKYKVWTIGTTIPMYAYMMPLSGTNSVFADQNGNWKLTTDPNFKKAIEALKKIKDAGIAAEINEWTPDWDKAFADGVLVSYPNASWLAQANFLPKYAPEQKSLWHATQWPSFIGENGGSEAGGAVWVIPSFANEKEASKEFLALKYLNREGWFLHQKVGGSPVAMMKSWIDDPRAKEPHFYIGGDFSTEMLKSIESFKIFSWDPSAALELSIVNPHFDGAVLGKTDIDTGLRNAEADLKNQVGNPWNR